MAGNITGTITFFLQRRLTTGAWTTIDTSDTLSINISDPDVETVVDSGDISVTFNAATLDWAVGAQYRIQVRKSLTDSASAISITAAEGRMYSVSIS